MATEEQKSREALSHATSEMPQEQLTLATAAGKTGKYVLNPLINILMPAVAESVYLATLRMNSKLSPQKKQILESLAKKTHKWTWAATLTMAATVMTEDFLGKYLGTDNPVFTLDHTNLGLSDKFNVDDLDGKVLFSVIAFILIPMIARGMAFKLGVESIGSDQGTDKEKGKKIPIKEDVPLNSAAIKYGVFGSASSLLKRASKAVPKSSETAAEAASVDNTSPPLVSPTPVSNN